MLGQGDQDERFDAEHCQPERAPGDDPQGPLALPVEEEEDRVAQDEQGADKGGGDEEEKKGKHRPARSEFVEVGFSVPHDLRNRENVDGQTGGLDKPNGEGGKGGHFRRRVFGHAASIRQR